MAWSAEKSDARARGGTSVKRDGSRERSQRGRGGGQWPHHQHHRPHHRPLPPPRRLWLPTQGDRQFFLSHRGVRSKPRLMLRRPSRCSLTSLASNLGRLSCSSGGDHSRAGQRNGKFKTTPLSACVVHSLADPFAPHAFPLRTPLSHTRAPHCSTLMRDCRSMRSGFEPESQTPCSIGLVVIKSMQVKAREQAPHLCSGSAF